MSEYNSTIATLLAKLAGYDVEIPDDVVSVNAELLKECISRIESFSNVGRYLAVWDCTTGKPTTDPSTLPYTYTTGMWYIVGTTGATNYKPSGDKYTGAASTTAETSTVQVGDMYRYDGTTWELLTFSAAYNAKEDKANKVTAFQATPDDTHYPSEKLVKDKLDTKVNSANVSHETWTITLENNTTITKDVMTWIS